MENVRKQLEDLQLVLYNKDAEIQHLKDRAIVPTDAAVSKQTEIDAPEVSWWLLFRTWEGGEDNIKRDDDECYEGLGTKL